MQGRSHTLLEAIETSGRDQQTHGNVENSVLEKGLKSKKEIGRDAESLSSITVEAEVKPPYRAVGWYDSFFDLLKQRKLNRIDLEFIKHNVVTDTSDARKFRLGLVFLGLIDSSGIATRKLEGLYLTGEDFRRNLEIVVRDAYASLFATIVLERARRESILNFLIENYSFSPTYAERAVQLFVHFCGKAGIPLSPELTESSRKPADPEPKTPREALGQKRQAKQESKAQRAGDAADNLNRLDDSFARLEFDDFAFKVRKDPQAIEFARSQVNSLLDYLTSRVKQNNSPPPA